MGDAWGRSIVGSGGNAVGDDLYREMKGNVTQWVALRPVFEICAGETGYKGGGHRREAWWRQGAADKNFGQPWKKYCGMQVVGGNGNGKPHSRNQGKVDNQSG